MRVRLAVYLHAGPAVDYDLDVAGVDVRVGLDKVVAQDACKDLGGGNVILLCEDVDGLLLGIGSNDGLVVCDGVSRIGLGNVGYYGCVESAIRFLDITLEQSAHGHLGDMLDTAGFLLDLVKADKVLSVPSIAEFGHCDEIITVRGCVFQVWKCGVEMEIVTGKQEDGSL